MYTIKERLEGGYGIGRVPQYAASRCSARKTRGEACTVCADICPQKIYPYGKRKRPVWDQCVRCGLCAAACPARCITPPADRVNAYLMAAVKRCALTVGCDAQEHACHLSLNCVAALSWEQLAYAALHEGVILALGGCAQCGRTYEAGVIRDNLERLKFFLGEETYARKVRVLTEGEPLRRDMEETVSRRELLRFVGNMPLDRAFAALPRMENRRDSGLFYRAMLRDAADAAGKDETAEPRQKFGMLLPKFNGTCYRCGYCVRSCPNEALKILDSGGSFTVTVEAWKCTGCGICRNICRVDGISGIVPARVSHLGTVALGRFSQHLCARCGTPVPRGSELCGVCLSQTQRRRPAQEGPRDEENR